MNPVYRMGLMAVVFPVSVLIFCLFLGCCAHAAGQAAKARWLA